jgi:hypothetical protein
LLKYAKITTWVFNNEKWYYINNIFPVQGVRDSITYGTRTLLCKQLVDILFPGNQTLKDGIKQSFVAYKNHAAISAFFMIKSIDTDRPISDLLTKIYEELGEEPHSFLNAIKLLYMRNVRLL